MWQGEDHKFGFKHQTQDIIVEPQSSKIGESSPINIATTIEQRPILHFVEVKQKTNQSQE